MLHGVGGNHASWFYQIAAWRNQFQMVLVDARGFGNSSDPERLGRSAFTEDLVALLDDLDLDTVSLIGQSMGGGTAIDFACQFPNRVSSLVIADSLVGLELPRRLADQMQIVQQRTSGLDQLGRVLGRSFIVRESAMATLYLQIAGFNQYTVKTLVGEQKTHTPEELARSDVRIAFLVGEEDVLFPPEIVSEVVAMVPGATFYRLPATGHSAYFEAPDAFNSTIGNWLQEAQET
ncbi:hypothetical protein A6V36_18065 [Paraburkholderia ginsengiterrae]|uniref:AB hydrolase-1 domain-containing protein n=2 Tax=Paraburkholderia ginsengiterrae TaxID=1462993 RepID=A0A1A9MYS7_9BURK|nr:hypothetical protein A6V37_10245 [Paraburkholderia ginsengiterrae]OAJ63400.1 hypothetical protein A6V36_18065 [Paraburkholderia ginsengiterrae]